jgi:phosphonate transport system substrate-binding protein
VAVHTLWQPFVQRVARDAGVGLRLKVYERMSDFERDISRGGGDFLFSSPLQLVVGHQLQGYVPLVRGGRPVSAQLFVRSDSPVRSVDALAGRKIAFVGNKSFCSIFTRDQISRHGDPMWFEQEYEGSSANVVLSVLRGKADAGAAFVPDLEKEPREHREQIRAVLQTPGIASHPISAHPRVPERAREALTRAVLALGSDAEAARLLETLRMSSPVVADYGKDYQALEAIDVRGLSSWGE